MKCQSVFSGKSKKNNSICRLLKMFTQRAKRYNTICEQQKKTGSSYIATKTDAQCDLVMRTSHLTVHKFQI